MASAAVMPMSIVGERKPSMSVFNAKEHPTYMKDLEKVSKIIPVASFGSLSTLAGSDDELSLPGSARGGNDEQMSMPVIAPTPIEIKTMMSEQVRQREAIVKRLGAGHDYKIARLARLEQRLAAAERVDADDLYAMHDYDCDVLGMMWAVEEKKALEPEIGGRAGGMYIQKIKPNDAWSRLDCDTDISEALADNDGMHWALPAAAVSKPKTSKDMNLKPSPISNLGNALGQFRFAK